MTSSSTGSGASRLREAANEAVASLPRSAPHGAALAGMCFAALLMASSCAVQRDLSAFAPVESAVAVRAGSTDSLIGKTIIVAWRERTEVCSLGQESASERCESDESVNERIIAVTAQVPPLSYGTSQFLLRQRPHAAGVPTLLSARG